MQTIGQCLNSHRPIGRFSSTRYIKHLAESANFKGGTFNKHYNGLIGNRFEMLNVSYRQNVSKHVKRHPWYLKIVRQQRP